jgi:hypothetical protein
MMGGKDILRPFYTQPSEEEREEMRPGSTEDSKLMNIPDEEEISDEYIVEEEIIPVSLSELENSNARLDLRTSEKR